MQNSRAMWHTGNQLCSGANAFHVVVTSVRFEFCLGHILRDLGQERDDLLRRPSFQPLFLLFEQIE